MGTWVSANGHEGVWRLRKRRQVKSRRFFSGVAVFKGIRKGVLMFFSFLLFRLFFPSKGKKTISCGLSFYNLFV